MEFEFGMGRLGRLPPVARCKLSYLNATSNPIYREVVKFQDSPYPIQIPSRGFHPKIGKILNFSLNIHSDHVFADGGYLNWIGGVLNLYDLAVLGVGHTHRSILDRK